VTCALARERPGPVSRKSEEKVVVSLRGRTQCAGPRKLFDKLVTGGQWLVAGTEWLMHYYSVNTLTRESLE